MDYGLYTPCCFSDAEVSDHQTLYKDAIEQAKFAEDIGFTSISVPEHHFIDDFMVPSALMLAVRMAASTNSVRFITAVLPLPLHNPLRLAGEALLADHLTGGRIDLGLARGSFDYEFRRFGVTFDNNREYFQETVELLERLLTEEDVTANGSFHQIEDPTTITPRPFSEPRPPFWIGAMSEGSMQWAVERGHNVLTTPLRQPFELTRKQGAWFTNARDALQARGDHGGPIPQLHLLTQVYVSKDKKQIERMADLVLLKEAKATAMVETAGAVKGGRVTPIDVDVTRDDVLRNLVIGDPEFVATEIARRGRLGFDGIQLDIAFGAAQREILESLELFGDEVIPMVREAMADKAGVVEGY